MEWFDVLKRKKKSTVNRAGNYTKPTMRKRIFNRIKAGSKGGNAGQWSARKAQMLARAYKKALVDRDWETFEILLRIVGFV